MLSGCSVGLYTSVYINPTPVITALTYNRFLNPLKLTEIKFCMCPPSMALKQFEKMHRLPDRDKVDIKGNLRVMVKKDATILLKLYNSSYEKYKIRHKFG